jgi:NADH-quinone oxidoreductase subunit K
MALPESIPSTEAYLMLSGTLFAVGLMGVIIRRNMITVLMAIELMLNAVNINLVAFSERLGSLEGQIFAIFVITVAAGEAAVGLAIIIQLYRLRSTVNIDEVRTLNG